MATLLLLLPPGDFKEGAPLARITIWADLFVLFVVPVAAILLTIPKKTCSFALGLLMACGVCWLVELTICGGYAALNTK